MGTEKLTIGGLFLFPEVFILKGLIMATKKTKFKLFRDILRENGKYSQGRVYLFWSIVAYYITLGIITINGINKSDVDMENFKLVVDALEYAMTLFAGYVFGGKAIQIAKIFKNGTNNPTNKVTNYDNEGYDEYDSDTYPDDSDNI